MTKIIASHQKMESSDTKMIWRITTTAKKIQSRDSEYQSISTTWLSHQRIPHWVHSNCFLLEMKKKSNLIPGQLTTPESIPQKAGAARMLKTSEPTTVPTPMSPWVTKVPMMLKNNSGMGVPMAIMVAPATSADKCNSANTKFHLNWFSHSVTSFMPHLSSITIKHLSDILFL